MPGSSELMQDLKLVDFSDLLPAQQEVVDLSDLLMPETGPDHLVSQDGTRFLPQVPDAIKRLSHTHQAIMDYMLANPSVALGDVAKHFGYTQPWLSTVINSDTFQKAFRERRTAWENIHDGRLAAKLTQVAERSLDRLLDALEEEGDDKLSPKAANDIARTALNAIGFAPGSKKTAPEAAGPSVAIHITADDVKIAQQILAGGHGAPQILPSAD